MSVNCETCSHRHPSGTAKHCVKFDAKPVVIECMMHSALGVTGSTPVNQTKAPTQRRLPAFSRNSAQ